jgi:hypothetical protein
MALYQQDPLSVAAPVLKSGPGALEVGYKRMAMEQDAGKLAAQQQMAADKLKQKQQQQNSKAFELDYGTVALPDTVAFMQKMGEENEWLAQKLMDFDSGKGDDPRDPMSKSGMERLMRGQAIKQWVSNSKQKTEHGNTLLGLVRANPFAYADGAEDAVVKWMSDYEVNDSGKMIDPLQQYFDLDKALDTILGDLKASGGGNAVTLPDGSIKESQSEYVTPEAILAGVEKTLQIHGAKEEAVRRFQRLADTEPDRAAAVMELAKSKGIPVEKAMLWNELVPVYSFNKYRETLEQASESGAGARNLNQGIAWFAETSKAIEEGIYSGDLKPEEINTDDPRGAIGINPFTGNPVKEVGDYYDIYNGFVLKKGTMTGGAGGNTKLPNNVEIEGVKYDRNTDEWVVKSKEEGTGKEMPILRIPKEKWISEIGDQVAGHNQELFKGFGALLNVTDKEYQKVKGSGGLNLEGSTTKKKTGALDIGNAGELD